MTKEQLQSLLEQVHEALATIAMCDDLTFDRCQEIVAEAYVPLDEALALVRGSSEPGVCACIPLAPRPAKYCSDSGKLIPQGASRAEPLERRPEETGWLIELAIKGIPHWLMVSSDREWTTDSNEALRFAREQDAETMLYHSGPEGAKATSHTWCDPLPNKGAQETGLCPHGMPQALSECLPCVGGAPKSSEQLTEAEKLLQAWANLLPPNGRLYWIHVEKAREYFRLRQQGASRDASSEKSETVKDSCGPGCAMGANRPAQKSDEIRDLACCDVFTRESASEFCATCGYTNLDHLRRRANNGSKQS